MLHLIFSVPCFYVLIRFVAPLPWPLTARVALGAIMLVASQYHLWCRISSGSVFSPEFSRPLILAFNWAFGAILLLAAFQLAIELGSLALAALRSGPRYPRQYATPRLASPRSWRRSASRRRRAFHPCAS